MAQIAIMQGLISVLLWGGLTVIIYTYVGYPLLLLLWSRHKCSAVDRRSMMPSVSIVIAAWNEAPRLAARINNCFEQHYPSDRLEIIIVSDGSTDDTVSVVSAFGHRVRLVRLEKRQGKAVALNAGVAAAGGEVIVFAEIGRAHV